MMPERTADRSALRLAATLVLVGFVVAVVAQYAHTTIDGSVSSSENHPAEFIAIANSALWTAVALAQFLATLCITAGLLAVSYALNLTSGIPMAVNRLGAAAAAASVALNGAAYAVDGVALKQAVDAWVQAPVAEQEARFASAEALRWLQWGTSSYQTFLFALALLLVATAIVWTGRIARPIGVLMGLQGLAYLVVGWDIGTEGLALTGPLAVAYYLGSAVLFLWMVWLVVFAWRMRKAVPTSHG
jgi:hypothetical protein